GERGPLGRGRHRARRRGARAGAPRRADGAAVYAASERVTIGKSGVRAEGRRSGAKKKGGWGRGSASRWCAAVGGADWTFAVSELAALSVKVQVGLFTPALLHAPDQITDRPLVALRVMLVPTKKLAEPVVPTGTLSPAGLERTRSPARPVAVRVSSAA